MKIINKETNSVSFQSEHISEPKIIYKFLMLVVLNQAVIETKIIENYAQQKY